MAIYNVTDSADMLLTNTSVQTGQTIGVPGTVDPAHAEVATDDVLRVDVKETTDIPPEGLLIDLRFERS